MTSRLFFTLLITPSQPQRLAYHDGLVDFSTRSFSLGSDDGDPSPILATQYRMEERFLEFKEFKGVKYKRECKTNEKLV